jgi:hypothetical protein
MSPRSTSEHGMLQFTHVKAMNVKAWKQQKTPESYDVPLAVYYTSSLVASDSPLEVRTGVHVAACNLLFGWVACMGRTPP